MKIDEKVARYIGLRQGRAEIKKIYTENDADLKSEMKQIEGEILNFLNETGQDSAKTIHGTAYRQQTMSATVSNGADFFKFVFAHDAADLLEKRVNKTAYKSYLEDNIEVPGVTCYTEDKVMIRKT